MTKLYELADNYRSLVAQVEEYDLSPQTLLDTLEGSSQLMSIEEKAGNIVRMAKNWESEVLVFDTEIKRLTERKKAIENRVKGIKDYLKSGMEFAGIDKIKVDTFAISLQNNPASLVIGEGAIIPTEFITIIPEQFQPNKAMIKEALKNGREFYGVSLEVGRSLRIR